jgi:hypothetical protein
MRHVCSSTYDLVKVLLFVDTLSWWNRTKLWVPLLLTGNADDSDKLPPHRIGIYKSLHCFKNVKTSPKNIMQVQCRICALYLTQLDNGKLGLKINIILPLIDNCSADSNTFLRTIKVFFPGNCTSQLQPLDVGIIHAFKCSIKSNSFERLLP